MSVQTILAGWTATELWLLAYAVVITVLYFVMQGTIYKNGVWDGAYCQFLPHVQKICGEYHRAGSVKACQRETHEAWHGPVGACPHGHKDWDDCPTCCH